MAALAASSDLPVPGPSMLRKQREGKRPQSPQGRRDQLGNRRDRGGQLSGVKAVILQDTSSSFLGATAFHEHEGSSMVVVHARAIHLNVILKPYPEAAKLR